MKKALIYGLSLALVFALSACASTQDTISQEQEEQSHKIGQKCYIVCIQDGQPQMALQ